MDEDTDRYKWELEVTLSMAAGGRQTFPVNLYGLTWEEAQKEAERIAAQGVWCLRMLFPPHRIYCIMLRQTENQDDDQG